METSDSYSKYQITKKFMRNLILNVINFSNTPPQLFVKEILPKPTIHFVLKLRMHGTT